LSGVDLCHVRFRESERRRVGRFNIKQLLADARLQNPSGQKNGEAGARHRRRQCPSDGLPSIERGLRRFDRAYFWLAT
jgi:hypothetical protein